MLTNLSFGTLYIEVKSPYIHFMNPNDCYEKILKYLIADTNYYHGYEVSGSTLILDASHKNRATQTQAANFERALCAVYKPNSSKGDIRPAKTITRKPYSWEI